MGHTTTATAQRHILVLEDDHSISELLDWVLEEAGYDVTCATTIREARQVVQAQTPDMIIADLLLPDGLGSDLLKDINSTHNGDAPPAIMMSALPQARQHAASVGARLCLTKPFDLTELLDAVSQYSGARVDTLEAHPQ